MNAVTQVSDKVYKSMQGCGRTNIGVAVLKREVRRFDGANMAIEEVAGVIALLLGSKLQYATTYSVYLMVVGVYKVKYLILPKVPKIGKYVAARPALAYLSYFSLATYLPSQRSAQCT
jgi:hypothetical protein